MKNQNVSAMTAAAPIPVGAIRPDPKNRKDFDPAALSSLAASIEAEGLLQSILVRRLAPDEVDAKKPLIQFQIIAGERRWLAHQQLKRETIMASVLDASVALQGGAVVKRAVENLQRENLTPIETAVVYQQLLDAGKTHGDIAKISGRSQPDVSNTLRLLKLPADVQTLIEAGALTRAHGVALCQWAAWPKACAFAAASAVANNKSARDLEQQFPETYKARGLGLMETVYAYDNPPKAWATDPDCVPMRQAKGGYYVFNLAKVKAWQAAKEAEQKKQVAAVQTAAKSGKITAEAAAAKLKRAKVIAENKQRRADARATLDRVLARLKATTTPDLAALAVVINAALCHDHYASSIGPAAKALGLPLPKGFVVGYEAKSYAAIGQLSLPDALRLAAAAIAIDEGETAIKHAHRLPAHLAHLDAKPAKKR